MLKRYAAKLLQYVKAHRLAVIVFAAILVYQTARLVHMEVATRPFELMIEPIIEVILARFIGGAE